MWWGFCLGGVFPGGIFYVWGFLWVGFSLSGVFSGWGFLWVGSFVCRIMSRWVFSVGYVHLLIYLPNYFLVIYYFYIFIYLLILLNVVVEIRNGTSETGLIYLITSAMRKSKY